MTFQFFLNSLEVDEPQGFAEILFNVKREKDWHGIFFEASTSELKFYGNGAEYLRQIKKQQGLKAEVVFTAFGSCGVYDQMEELISGRLNFGQYNEGCGNECWVAVPVEQTGCIMVMRNRYDQKVDMDADVAFNKLIAVQKYDKLGFDLTLPAKAIKVAIEGYVEDDGDHIDLQLTNAAGLFMVTLFRPTYARELNNSIKTGQLQPTNNFQTTEPELGGILISPQVLYEEKPGCFDGNFNYNFRFKGTFGVTSDHTPAELTSIKIKVVTWDGVGDINTDATIIHETTLPYSGTVNTSINGVFDESYSGVIALAEGLAMYGYIEIKEDWGVFDHHAGFAIVFEKETYFNLSATKICGDTTSNVYMVNEALSHIVECMTDQCFKVKSDYYGRTDSEPFASSGDGCGGLRVVTPGLMLRNADNAKFFLSLKDLFEGLRGIDNIGMGVEDDVLRIEPVEHFYTDEEILRLPFVPVVSVRVDETQHYSIIKSGYDKWETENIAGLDEVNSPREFRTSLSAINQTFDAQSHLVAGSYPIELTRQQNFADTGAADTKYDNETFIICVKRQAYGFSVEQGGVDNASGFFDPPTIYNWRIRPFYNLMRWFKSLANSYANIVDTDNKLFFSSGKGNYLASGEIAFVMYEACKLENGAKAENEDLSAADFTDKAEATPLWRPELATLTYPLSLKDYKKIKASPYGYISFQCGTGEWQKGYIQELRYGLVKGEANFTLKLKW